MKRALFALPMAATLGVVGWLFAHDRAAASGVCELMTPARMLEQPALGYEYAQALRSGDAGEIARVRALLQEIRAAHGCRGEIALPSLAPEDALELPPGHPPVRGRAREESPRALFEAPATISI